MGNCTQKSVATYATDLYALEQAIVNKDVNETLKQLSKIYMDYESYNSDNKKKADSLVSQI
jgi:hypothetical protein